MHPLNDTSNAPYRGIQPTPLMTPIATWWSLPKWLTNLIQPKNKTSFTFTAFKHDGQWFFHAPLLLTWWEGLAPVAQLEELANGKDKVKLTVCTYPVKGALKLTYQEDDPLDLSASIYFDPQLRTVWLCGWLPWYFQGKPAHLYVTTTHK